MGSDKFTQLLNTNEKQAWNCLKAEANGFLRNNRADNYQVFIETMLESFKIMGRRMSHKLLCYILTSTNFKIIWAPTQRCRERGFTKM